MHMEWSDIPGMNQNAVDALYAAGIASPIALAGVDNEAALAQKAGLPAQDVEAFCAAARVHIEQALGAAGIDGPEALARSEPGELAEKTGIPEEYLLGFVEHARAATGIAPPERAHEPPAVEPETAAPPATVDAPDADAPDAVLLMETSSKARVRVAGALHDGIPILTARATDDADALLAQADADTVVVLQEWANTAPAKIAGHALAPLPLFRVHESGEEERVRVKALKGEPASAPAPAPADAETNGNASRSSLVGRFLGRRRS